MQNEKLTLKHRLAAGDPILGTFLKTTHPHVVEVLATCGFDCVCIDAEHAPFDRQSMDLCLLAARAGGLPALVRPPSALPHHYLAALDSGADGVLVPHIRTASEARELVQAVHFGPGGRGYAGSTRAAGYGLTPMSDHRQRSAERTVAIAQIEDAEALVAIDEIALVEGLDALFVGRIDLTVSLGCRSPDDPQVEEAVGRIVDACAKAGKPVGMFLPRATDVPAWRARGASFFLLGSDHSLMRSGARQLRAESGLG